MSPECVMGMSLSAAGRDTLVVVSEWSTRVALEDLLRSQEFLVLRGMRMLLQKDTQLVVDEVAARTVLVLDD